ncbi:RecQ family ATP-dependent DNA helicase [Sansalvadorimonas sp. 2012CJ34-2]|uniref:DNA 3'-5' helicase n=1 Tax=Parendozoicomonas callyspongiae TaxID=2942213 RepID=A0ABT0PI53_9GAMM|nr:RecQ family ATP-dependent DNA helicase [Sansalvadorimonas sp. 2012CJ34-2]MCL6270442.1 RecQ family ATP-dependent DNA helicase [Sansalvadorimonas sp. 2012CJ34-2]
MDRVQAQELLRIALDKPEADFRDGQWEAIDALVNHNQKLLVVQRTGWGKSSVYFISTKIFRDRGRGVTIIISPLLALMRNQIDAAARLGVAAVTLNSTNREEWDTIKHQILNDDIDCLLISPERLANDDFINDVLMPVASNIGLMVVDEAHCISDWGHDFRPDYRRIINILQRLPANTPVLGTTATANNRVVEDIQSQLGDIVLHRGPLIRDGLSLQTLELPDQASRLAWLAQTIPQLDGTGIVYVLTKRDADQVASWLVENDINAKPYYSDVVDPAFENSDQYRQHLEDALLNNEIDVLVATTALGMGYDKPDLAFVIHFQAPGSIVAYYQQVGRAGRGIDSSVGVLLSGREDRDIHEYFRGSAFPSEDEVNQILEALDNADGLTVRQLEEHSNVSMRQIEKVLKMLSIENPAPIFKDGSSWYRTANPFTMDHDRIAHLTQQRETEWQEVQNYMATDACLMTFLRNSLDDDSQQPCGRCVNCLGRSVVDTAVDRNMAHQAAAFMKQAETIIKPKKQTARNSFVHYGFPTNLPAHLQAEEGRVLSRWGDAGWGNMVADDKHTGHFRDELVAATAEMIRERWNPAEFPMWVCCVPSRNHPELVPNFAQRLALALGLPFVDAIAKTRDNELQKLQQNRYRRCRNLDNAFAVTECCSGPVLLVDDIVDSGWTFTVTAALLRQAGSGNVYPVALASTSTGD